MREEEILKMSKIKVSFLFGAGAEQSESNFNICSGDDYKKRTILLKKVNNEVYFGEMTFTSQGGFMDFYTPEFNKELGKMFDIKDFPLKKK